MSVTSCYLSVTVLTLIFRDLSLKVTNLDLLPIPYTHIPLPPLYFYFSYFFF